MINGVFLISLFITHALSVHTQMSAINCLYESYKIFEIFDCGSPLTYMRIRSE